VYDPKFNVEHYNVYRFSMMFILKMYHLYMILKEVPLSRYMLKKCLLYNIYK